MPVLTAERARGRSGAGSAMMLAAWIDYTAANEKLQDQLADAISAVNAAEGLGRVAALLNLVSQGLGDDQQAVALVAGLCGTFTKDANSTVSGTETTAHRISERNS